MKTKQKPSTTILTRLGGPRAGTLAALAMAQDGGETLFVGSQVGLFRSIGRDLQIDQAWERLATAPLGIVALGVSPLYAEDHTVIAGTSAGIFVSRDRGETWGTARMSIAGSVVISIVFSPNYHLDGIVLAGSLEDGLFYSNNRGQTWHSRNFGVLDATVFSFAFSPGFARDATVYAATETTVYHSYNGGLAWKDLSFPDEAAPVLSLAVSPGFANDHTLYAGTEKQGLHRSADGGKTWQKLPLSAECVNAVVISPATQAVIAATEAGVFGSEDQGATWTRVLDQANVISLLSTPDTLIAGVVEQGLWLSSNRGDWQPIANLSTRALVSLVLSPAFDKVAVAYLFGPQEGIWRTDDGGRGWASLDEDLPTLDIAALALSSDAAQAGACVAASDAGILVSQDAGNHWEPVAAEPAGFVSFSPDGAMLAAGFLDGTVRSSQDLGATWAAVAGPGEAGGKVAALAAGNGNHFHIAWLEGAGETLTVWQGQPGQLQRVLSQPAGENAVVTFCVPANPAPERFWYASLGNQVWKFSTRASRPPSRPAVVSFEGRADNILSMAGLADPTNPVLLASTGQHLFKSSDAKSWSLVYDFGSERAISLALSPSYPADKTVYALLLGGSVCQVLTG